jgi:hypothetical protein
MPLLLSYRKKAFMVHTYSEKVGFAALDFKKLKNKKYGQDDIYYIHEDFMVPMDPDQMFEGAAIPRRFLREPDGSRGDIAGHGRYEDNYWVVEMSRPLDTGYIDDKVFTEGRVYTVAFSVHKEATGSRWHYISYPYELRLDVDSDIEGIYFEGDEPDWNQIKTEKINLIYPGQVTWTWLTSKKHPGYRKVRSNSISVWDILSDPSDMARASLLTEEPSRAVSWSIIFFGRSCASGKYLLYRNSNIPYKEVCLKWI